MTRLARLMAEMEGWGKPGVIPTRDNNPLDLRHSPHSSHVGEDSNAIGEIDSIADGWADADRQLQIWANDGLTLEQAIEKRQAPVGDGNNNPDAYLQFICKNLPGTPDMLMSEAIEVKDPL